GLPDVAGRLVLAEGRANLVGEFPAHPPCSGTKQPPLEVTDQVAGPAWLCHLLSSPLPGRFSTRFFRPLRAVSMILFSGRRFGNPGIGIRRTTASSEVACVAPSRSARR